MPLLHPRQALPRSEGRSRSRRSTSTAAIPPARDRLVALTGRYTVPQILIGDLPIGGWDEMKALHDAGELDPLLGVDAA